MSRLPSIPSRAVTLLRGDTPRPLAFRLRSQNVRSGAVRLRPGLGDVVEWEMRWPAGTVTKTSAAGGGLSVDLRTRVTRFPIAPSDIAPLVAGKPVAFTIRILNSDGIRRTYASGTLTVQDIAP